MPNIAAAATADASFFIDVLPKLIPVLRVFHRATLLGPVASVKAEAHSAKWIRREI
jgi:hypothetical protein